MIRRLVRKWLFKGICVSSPSFIRNVSSLFRIRVGVKELASAIVVLLSIRVGRIIDAFIAPLMDENTICLWLKEQRDATEKLAQIEAFRAELQVATGVLQGRPGGGGDQGSLLPRSMRLDVSKISGADPESWLFFIQEYFTLLNTPVDQRLRIVGFNLEGLMRSGTVAITPKSASTSGGAPYQRSLAVVKTPLLPTPPKTTVNPTWKPLAIKWISPTKHQDRLNKGEEFATRDDEAVKSGDISIFNSLVGHGSPRSLQLWGKIGTTEAFKVYIGSGETLLCENVCSRVTLHMQGLEVEVDLYVLPMQGPDVVLGIHWLQKLGKVTHDYAQQIMEFALGATTYTLKGDESLRMKKISLHCMQALLYMEGVPTCLPPSRSVDHRIHLLPNTKPVNVRSYRYPHYQKGEMEKLVNEMLSQGIIRFSHSPFSSLVLLVKKKDGSYHFCVDYRALNSVTATMNRLFSTYLRKSVIVFFDDILVYSTTLSLHLENLECVFRCLREHQFLVKHSKCVFRAGELEAADAGGCHLSYVEFNVGDMVLVKLQPYRQITLAKRLSNKLAKRYYGPYKVEAHVGKVAYRLALPASSKIHSVFHVSILKAFFADSSECIGESLEEATWEWLIEFWAAYPTYNLDDKIVFEEGGMIHRLVRTWLFKGFGHEGIKKRLVGLSALFFWKGMRKSVEEFIKKCLVCQQIKYSTDALGGIYSLFLRPRQCVKTSRWTSLRGYRRHEAEYCYNLSYHGSIKMSPFQALCGRLPLSVIPYPPGSSKVAAVDELLVDLDGLLRQLKDSLLSAKQRMEVKAYRKSRDIEFNVRDMVLVKLQPYRQITLAIRLSNNEVVTNFPEEFQDGQPVEQPLAIRGTRVVLRNGRPDKQYRVQWIGESPEEATWNGLPNSGQLIPPIP
nr:hypothetical protein [Tanacetum cinerariifolium]